MNKRQVRKKLRCIYYGREQNQELDMESIFDEARKTVQPLIDRERQNEYVPSSVFDFKMR